MAEKIKTASFNIQNEMIVLANMIKSTKVRRKLSKELKPYHFIGKKHRTIFNILCRLVEKNLEFDLDVFETLAKDDEEYGSLTYIQKIEKLFQESDNIEFHVNQLKVDSLKAHIKERRLGKLSDAIEDPHSELTKVVEIVDQIKREIAENTSKANMLSGIDLRKGWWKDYQQRKKESIYTPTGISGLDRRLTEGLARTKCSIWSARPGMGKTTTMANIALRLSTGLDYNGIQLCEPKKVLLVPLETGYVSYIDIMVSMLVKQKIKKELEQKSEIMPNGTYGIKLEKLVRYTDQITVEEDKYIKWALDQIFCNNNLVVTDNPSMKLSECETILEENNFDICIMDLWEKFTDIKIDAASIAEKLNKTQAIAKECNTHMAIVQQIKRSEDKKGKKNKRPTIDMLKNSGGYEEIADLIIMMHRERYYDPEIDDDIIEYIIGKQRRGAMNKTAYHIFDADYGIIGDYVKAYSNNNDDVF
ncbi:MAG: replicative helicase [Sedimentibacter sp.]|jgi:replicative DNA helicase|nr:replicative helicase [Sedimentibacter sp.]